MLKIAKRVRLLREIERPHLGLSVIRFPVESQGFLFEDISEIAEPFREEAREYFKHAAKSDGVVSQLEGVLVVLFPGEFYSYETIWNFSVPDDPDYGS